jgi:hypothetical protein
MITVFKMINGLDRRILFIIIAISVILPLIRPIGLPVAVTPITQTAYDVVDSLKEGDRLLLSFDFDPASEPELFPMAKCVIRHCFRKNIRVVAIALWAQGPMECKKAFDEVTSEYEFKNKVYGKDYINLGVRPSYLATVKGMGTSFPNTFPVDFNEKPVADFEIMKGLNNYKEIGAIFSLTTGSVGISTYLALAQLQYNVKVTGGCTAVSALEYYPYLQSKQLLGLLEGMKGASEYEKLIKMPGKATSAMEPQSIVHIVLIFFILLANLSQYVLKGYKH